MMKFAFGKKLITVVLAITIVVSLFFVSFIYLNSQSHKIEKLDSVSVAYPKFESVALLWVASQQGFFEENGLNVTLHRYDTGVASLNAVLSNEADIAVGP